jgi:hypothetical protein
MPELEQKQADIVTYARFESTDRTSADFNRKLNQYIYENLPLTAEQKVEFRSLCIVNADGDPTGIRDSPSVDNEWLRRTIRNKQSKNMDALIGAAFAAPHPAVMAAVAPPPAIAVEQKIEEVLAAAVVAVVPDIGCKLDVWKGKAMRTRGGLMKHQLRPNKVGTIVSIRASDAAKRNGNLGKFLFVADQKDPCPDDEWT